MQAGDFNMSNRKPRKPRATRQKRTTFGMSLNTFALAMRSVRDPEQKKLIQSIYERFTTSNKVTAFERHLIHKVIDQHEILVYVTSDIVKSGIGWAWLTGSGSLQKKREKIVSRDTGLNSSCLLAIIDVCDEFQNKALTIHTDNLFVIRAYNKHLSEWQRRGWKRVNGEPLFDCDLWQKLYAFQQAGVQIHAPANGKSLEKVKEIVSALSGEAEKPRQEVRAKPTKQSEVAIASHSEDGKTVWVWVNSSGEKKIEKLATGSGVIRGQLEAILDAARSIDGVITFFTGNKFIEKVFETRGKDWQRQGWVSQLGRPIANQDLWIQALELREARALEFKLNTKTVSRLEAQAMVLARQSLDILFKEKLKLPTPNVQMNQEAS